MSVRHSLTGGSSVVHADIEAIRAVFFSEQPAYNRNLRPEGGEFLFGKFKYPANIYSPPIHAIATTNGSVHGHVAARPARF